MLALLTVLAFAAADKDKADAPKNAIEIRRAETKAAEGLVEAKVGSTDDKVYLHKEVELTQDDIASAKIGKDGDSPAIVEFVFTDEGAKKLAKFTADHKGKPLAVLVDGKVIVAPVIRDKLTDKAVLTGKFDNADLEKIVKATKKK